MNQPPFPLLLKLAAAAAAGTAALLSFRRHHRFTVLHCLRRNIRQALLHVPVDVSTATSPPAILVFGFRGHGKSAFVNTVCRALAGEAGPMVIRSETAPAGWPPVTATRWRVSVAVSGCGGWVEDIEEDEIVVREGMTVELIDAPPLPDPAAVTRADVEAALDAATAFGGGGPARPPECVVVVVRCNRPMREQHLAVKRLSEIAGVVRDRGLHMMVVLTHKRCLRNWKRAEELKDEVAFRARTDCVYFIENYTARCSTKCRTPTVVKNDYDTHYTALAIVRQCVEFAAQHRRQSPQKMIHLATPSNERIRERGGD